MMIGVPALALGDEQALTLECIKLIMGGVGTPIANSMLYRANREFKAYAYALETLTEMSPGAGYLAVRMSVRPERTEQARSMVMETMRTFRDRVTMADVELAQIKIGDRLRTLAEDPWEMAQQMGEATAMGVMMKMPHVQYQLASKITLRDVQALAKELFENVIEDMGVAVVGRDKGNALE